MPYLSDGEATGESIVRTGEKYHNILLSEIKFRGMDVEDVSKQNIPYDMVVNGHRVQCKFRTPTKRDGIVQLCFKRKKGADSLAYRLDELDVLALFCMGSLMLIPAPALVHKNGKTIKNTFDPVNYLHYADNWDVFSSRSFSPMQMRFPFMDEPDAP